MNGAGWIAKAASLAVCATLVSGCASGGSTISQGFTPSKFGTPASARVHYGEGTTPVRRGVYKIGNPYYVGGQRYVPRHEPNYDKVGIASWYGSDFHGRLTANGEIYDQNRLTAAHPTLPLPSNVRVTNMTNGRSIVVRVNDRGPFLHDRVIDLSRSAAHHLGFANKGLAKVRVTYLGPAPL
ncbi:Rare lipoprotein A (fragment) [Candidatus Filomicrobium marinum]